MRRGFTVLELIVAIVIIVVLVVLVLPAIGNVKRAAVRLTCANQLNLIGQATHTYRDTHGHFPPATVPGTQLPPDERMSFYVLLLPHIDAMYRPVHDQMKRAEPWNAEANRAAIKNINWGVFQCREWGGAQPPDVSRELSGGSFDFPKYANYVGIAGIGSDAAARPAGAPGIGMLGYDRTLKTEDVKDGLANTLLLIETSHELGPWIRGGPSTIRTIDPSAERLVGGGCPFGGTHYRERAFRPNVPDGFFVLLADGTVRYTKGELSPAVLAALATIAGGEDVPANW
jgi:prepilin-type N-terminal cleavage/methylation domain-containing protein